MLIGYARVSRKDQDLTAQRDALVKAGCEQVYEEKTSGAGTRPVLDQVMYLLRPGDTVVVVRLDRLTRSGLRDLIDRLDAIHKRGGRVRSISEPFDTSTPIGDALAQMLGVFAQMERRMLIERTNAGLDVARKRGVRLGRPPKLTQAQREAAANMIKGACTDQRIAEVVGVHRTTITRFRNSSA